MPWQHIQLTLARTPEHASGSDKHGYDLVAPVNQDGRFDEAVWRTDQTKAHVRRFWDGEEDQLGRLSHTRHRTWAFSYAPGEDDDEPIFHLETHRLEEGEYVTITEADGAVLPFRISAMAPLDV